MQQDDFVTKMCKIAIKSLYLVTNCNWIFFQFRALAYDIRIAKKNINETEFKSN